MEISINEVSCDDIFQLDDKQLTTLLKKLLEHEVDKYELSTSSHLVSLNIRAKDGGEDGRVEWKGGKTKTDWIPFRKTIFQVKAIEMPPKKCKEEILEKPKTIKQRIKKNWEESGAYVIFCNKNILNSKSIEDRINKISDAVKECKNAKIKNPKIYFYDANLIAQWTNNYPQLVSWVLLQVHGIQKTIFQTYDDWGKFSPEFQQKYFTNDKIEIINEEIKHEITQQGKSIRIVGLPGLGKTRLLYEYIKSNDIWKKYVLYADYNNFKQDWDLIHFIRTVATKNYKCLIIIDNCSVDIHDALTNIIKNKNINLITLSFDLDINTSTSKQIIISANLFIDIIPNIVEELFPRLASSDRNKICEFAQGFPLIAVLLARDKESGSPNMGRLNDDILTQRLLGVSKDSDDYIVLKACSIFTLLGYEKEQLYQRVKISENDLICGINKPQGNKSKSFYNTCEFYLKRGIIEKKGRYIFVKPKPLALRLANEWWDSCPPENVEEILEEVYKYDLSKELCDQIALLDFAPKAKETVEKLCGNGAPFGKAEVLISKEGSRLFRSLVEVNPKATIKALINAFNGYTIEQFRYIKEGRRNLIWALEKLLFRKETFLEASQILLEFAVGENEVFANNATSQFLHIFQILLAGTEADLNQRRELLVFLKNKGSDYNDIYLSSLIKSLQTHQFIRLGSAENQGSKPALEDYKPSYDEIINYWVFSLNELLDFYLKGLYRDRIFKAFISSYRGLVNANAIDIIFPLITVLMKEESNRIDLLKESKNIVLFDRERLSKQNIDKVNSLINELSPNDFAGRYKLYVSSPTWEESDGDSNFNYFQDNAKLIAREFISIDFNNIDFSLFYTGPQQEGYTFGKYVGENLKESYLQQLFFQKSVEALDLIPQNEKITNTLAGFLSGLTQIQKSKYYELLYNNLNLRRYLFYFIASSGGSYSDIENLFTLIGLDNITVSSFSYFQYGRSLDHLNSKEVHKLFLKISKYGYEGKWVAISLIAMYTHGNDKILLTSFKKLLRSLILTKGLFNSQENKSAMDFYHWSESCISLLHENDNVLAKFLIQESISMCSETSFNTNPIEYLKKVIDVLINKYFSIIWPFLSKVLVSTNYLTYYNIKNILDFGQGFYPRSSSLFDIENESAIIEFCKKNIKIAPQRIIGMVTLYTFNDKNEKQWNPFVKKLIDNFGDSNSFLISLSSNMHSFGWSGSLVPLLNEQIELLSQFRNHKYSIVRSWVKTEIKQLEEQIEIEVIKDAEGSI